MTFNDCDGILLSLMAYNNLPSGVLDELHPSGRLSFSVRPTITWRQVEFLRPILRGLQIGKSAHERREVLLSRASAYASAPPNRKFRTPKLSSNAI